MTAGHHFHSPASPASFSLCRLTDRPVHQLAFPCPGTPGAGERPPPEGAPGTVLVLPPQPLPPWVPVLPLRPLLLDPEFFDIEFTFQRP